jgi:C4-dicarboxylate transporter DctM subunit
MVSLALFGTLTIFLLATVPVGIAIGMSVLAAILAGGRLSLGFLSQALVTGVDSFPMMAIPLFILAGELMMAGGVSRRILNVSNVFFGRVTGGMAIVSVVSCLFFAAVSGSGPATVAAIGTMVIPSMLLKGYSKSFTLGLLACAGSLGVIIPPSIPMVLYGVSTGTSISAVFLAGFLPGMLLAAMLVVYCYFYSKKMGIKKDEEAFSWKRAGKALWEAKWALVNPIIILGGIYGGFFTPTEAGCIAAVYAIACGLVHRELDFKNLINSVGNACITIGTAMAILGCATAFARILTLERIPVMIAGSLAGVTGSFILMLLLINLVVLIIGTFMDPSPAMLILAPILMPIAVSVGVNPIHFGLIMVINLATGFITPPVGVNLNVAARVGNAKLEVVLKGAVPFIVLMIIFLMIITYIPSISMILPRILL